MYITQLKKIKQCLKLMPQKRLEYSFNNKNIRKNVE